MWKKTMYMALTALMFGSSAMAIEIPENPAVNFNKESTAYSSNGFNQVLEAYGLSFMAELATEVPAGYAKVQGAELVFNDLGTAYSPKDYHEILTAYGLELTIENAGGIVVRPYVQLVAEGRLEFEDNVSIAYAKQEWQNILSAYSLAIVEEVAVTAVTEEFDNSSEQSAVIAVDCPEAPEGAKVNERGCWEYSADVLFGFDKSTVNPDFHEGLRDIQRVFELNPGLKIAVEGYTCNVGRSEYNQLLSERRAKAVVDYLIDVVGVHPDTVTWTGFGEDRPAYSNETAEGRAKNRRVELKRWE
ncbi:OmpA family protein [Desulfosediminicola sp.]|uniref:OmpA family protein n=1 Tax=Desulfosediminicola sp. TaxID=2886825 RepID=UPI003AF2746A